MHYKGWVFDSVFKNITNSLITREFTVAPKNILSHFKREKEREDLANERSGIIFSGVSLSE